MNGKSIAMALILLMQFASVSASDLIDPDLKADDLENESVMAAMSHKQKLQLAIMLLRGEGRDKNVPAAIKLYQAVADKGIAFAHYRLAQIYILGKDLPQNSELGFAWLIQAAKLGFVDAQMELSEHYAAGLIVKQDYIEAHKWLMIAASLSESDMEDQLSELESKMSFWQRTRANYLGRRCIYRAYRDC